MRFGTIQCKCSQAFHFESTRDRVSCIQCDETHDVSSFPTKADQIVHPMPGELNIEEGE